MSFWKVFIRNTVALMNPICQSCRLDMVSEKELWHWERWIFNGNKMKRFRVSVIQENTSDLAFSWALLWIWVSSYNPRIDESHLGTDMYYPLHIYDAAVKQCCCNIMTWYRPFGAIRSKKYALHALRGKKHLPSSRSLSTGSQYDL